MKKLFDQQMRPDSPNMRRRRKLGINVVVLFVSLAARGWVNPAYEIVYFTVCEVYNEHRKCFIATATILH